MSTIKPTTVPSKRLAETISGSASSFKLNNIKGWDNADLTSADFGTVAYAVFRNSTGTLMEIMEIDPTTIASASITINKRGLKFTGDLTTEVAGNKLTWVKGDTIVELGSHPPQLLNSYVDLYNEQTIEGMKSVSNPTASGHIANKAYVDAAALGSATVDQLIVAATAGETIAAGELCYFDTTDNEWKLCDADTASSVNNVMLGIAQGAGTDGGTISGGMLLRGIDTNQTGMTQGDLMYASNTAGAIASSTGTTERVIGVARSATDLYFDPVFYYTLTAAQKSAISALPPSGTIYMYGAASAPTGFLLCDGSAVSRTTYADLFAVIGTTYGSGDGSTTFNVPNMKSSSPVGFGQRTEAFTFEDGDVNTSNEQITVDSNDYLHTGQAITLSTSGTLPTGLSAGTYYIIRVSATVVKLASSLANAQNDSPVNITAASGGGTHTITLTLTDRALADEGGEETHAMSADELLSHTHDETLYAPVNTSPTNVFAEGEETDPSGSASTQPAGGNAAMNNMHPYVVVNFIIKT